VKADLEDLLSKLVSADYPTHRLVLLARVEIEAAWGDLSAAKIANWMPG
jgi:hypothetical protein